MHLKTLYTLNTENELVQKLLKIESTLIKLAMDELEKMKEDIAVPA